MRTESDKSNSRENKDFIVKGSKSEPETTQENMVRKFSGGKYRYARFALAVLGSIPWVGGFLSASAALHAEKTQERINELQELWLQEHEGKIAELLSSLDEIFSRFDKFGDSIKDRIESEQYLGLVRRTFRSWDQADTREKKKMYSKLIINAGVIELCQDDLIRLFINWIDQYHEAHFLVIKEIYQNPGITRGEIWDRIHGERVREDSAEADLFKYLIRDLSTGGVIRQIRAKTADGEFIIEPTKKKHAKKSQRTFKSAFDVTEHYELTELGKQFVHYVMEDVVPQLKE